MGSHRPEEQPGFLLCLSVDGGPKETVWKVHRPVEIFDIELKPDEAYIGFPSPNGIVPLSTASWDKNADFQPFRGGIYYNQ